MLASTIQRTNCYSPLETEYSSVVVQPLQTWEESEVLSFLMDRPLHTVAMVGLIADNGLLSELNRGTFYGCRNSKGELEGVALIGHATLVATRTSRALQVLAETAQACRNAHLILGEDRQIEEFWGYYSEGLTTAGQSMRLACRELLFELLRPQIVNETMGLRPAKLEELDLIIPIQAQLAFEESGINPQEVDSEQFRLRCQRRLEQGRTWVLIDRSELLFKAEVMSDTPYVLYLEGIWTNPLSRGNNVALRCLSELAERLDWKSRAVCLLVNEKNEAAQSLYRKAGFTPRSLYTTIFLGKD